MSDRTHYHGMFMGLYAIVAFAVVCVLRLLWVPSSFWLGLVVVLFAMVSTLYALMWFMRRFFGWPV